MNEKDILTDQQLDDLICQSFERQQIADDISVAVMKDLRHKARRSRLHLWVRAIAFAFGLPLLLLLFMGLLWPLVSQHDQNPIVYLCLVFPVATMLYAAYHAIKNFSPLKV